MAARRTKNLVAFALVRVGVGSVAFPFLSPWWWTPIASNWGYVDHTIIITFWITGVAFIAIILFMAYCVFRYRHQEGRRAAYEPENKKLEWRSEEHTSELQSLMRISYAVFCLKKKTTNTTTKTRQ